MATPHSTYTEDTEQQSEASLSINGLLFLLRGSLRNYKSIKTACRARNWLVKRKDSALLISNSITSERFLRVCWYFVYIVVGWVSYAVTITGRTLFSWQTVENHLVHTSTNSYRIMTSSILSWFIFSQFIFSRKQVCPRKSWKFAPSKNFPLYSKSLSTSPHPIITWVWNAEPVLFVTKSKCRAHYFLQILGFSCTRSLWTAMAKRSIELVYPSCVESHFKPSILWGYYCDYWLLWW